MTDLRQPGDFAVCPIAGPGGLAIGAAEGFADVIARQMNFPAFTKWQHALVYVGGGRCLQAEPGGSRIVARPVYPDDLWSTGHITLPDAARRLAAATAGRWEGIPYSALDYLALAAHRLHAPDWPVWAQNGHRVSLQQFIKDQGHEICSQLVDAFLMSCGVHLFADYRWPGYVMPIDLGHVIEGGAVPYTGS